MVTFLVGLAIGIFAGGYGGYRWGASAEAKAEAIKKVL